MRKTANLCVRIEPEIKGQAEAILSKLGISPSSAINMFYKQIIMKKGIPFDVVLPTDISNMTAEEVNREIEKGLADYREGKVKSMKEFLSDISKEYE